MEASEAAPTTTALAAVDADDVDVPIANTLTREEMQAENKSWQDVMDLPATKKAETLHMLERVREQCVGVDERVDGAERLKGEANDAFRRGEYGLALRSYLTGLWLTRLDDPPLPKVLTEPQVPSGPALLHMLEHDALVAAVAQLPEEKQSDGTSTEEEKEKEEEGGQSSSGDADEAASEQQAVAPPPSAEEEAAAGEEASDTNLAMIRAALHLNVAAAAIKLEEWDAATIACEHALATEPTHDKALYRLAQAHEGRGEVSAALAVLSGRLLHHHPKHKEGTRLVAELKARSSRERRMFGGLFDRAQGGGGDDEGLYSKNALDAEAAAKKAERERLMKLENLAKLPPDMWAETMQEAASKENVMAKMRGENQELASQMPDDAWQKYAANMTPEKIEEAKQAVELHKAQEELRKQGLLPQEEDEPTEEELAYEEYLDGLVTKFAIGLALFVLLFAAVVHFFPGSLGQLQRLLGVDQNASSGSAAAAVDFAESSPKTTALPDDGREL